MYTSSRNFRTTLFAAVLAVATLSPAMHAQAPARAKAEIPFAFQVGSAHFEAGTYTFRDLAQHIISISSRSRSGLAVTRQETSVHPSPSSKIVFHKYGDRYFLAEVWASGDMDHVTVAKSKAEENVRKMQTNTASIAPESRIEVALLQGPK
jgi:hypothetical protein